jgi:ribonucleoside-diphosphate reductase alpha chain
MQRAEFAPRRDGSKLAGTNPCGEISLRPFQFCNLTEIIIEANDDEASLTKKAEIATILGTIQSSFTNFRYLRKIWRDNCEEERLLGVSLTGQFGNTLTSGKQGLDKLAQVLENMRIASIETNARVADAMGINRSTAITTVKPSGTVSQLTGTSSGMHPWHNPHYIRSVRQDNKDPLTSFMNDAGIPNEPDVMKPNDTTVFYFPQKAPEGAVTRDEVSAIEHLEFWKVYKTSWTEHNPSITVNVREDEWIEVATWVYKNWDLVGGISFLPYSEHTYQQAPYQDTDESGYNQFVADMPDEIDWSLMSMYEKEDNTSSSQTLACVSGSCDLVGSGNDLPTASDVNQ